MLLISFSVLAAIVTFVAAIDVVFASVFLTPRVELQNYANLQDFTYDSNNENDTELNNGNAPQPVQSSLIFQNLEPEPNPVAFYDLCLDSEISKLQVLNVQSQQQQSKSILEIVVPGIVGGLLALAGVLITAIWASKRESARTRFEWGKVLFERYEQHYREFIRSAEGTQNASQVRQYRERLYASAHVPASLREKVDHTLRVLEGTANTEQKNRAHHDLLREFEEFMQMPWAN